MRDLVILRGAPGCGKSTFINKNGLKPYTLCADNIRLMFQTPVMDHESGMFKITQNNDKQVWTLLFQLLEERMKRGEFTIIDACHSKSSDFSKYYNLADKYRYHLWCIDFSSVPIEVCKLQNKNRLEYQYVPETVIDNIYARFATNKIPNRVTCVTPENWEDILTFNPLNVDQYKKLVFIGDIHGCFDPLNEYFINNPFSEENLYVFLGDYFDRGIQNDLVCEWLLNHYTFKNVMLLTGNHDIWVTEYANEQYNEDMEYILNPSEKLFGYSFVCKSNEFITNTAPTLEKFSKKDLRQLCRKFIQCAYLQYGENKFICTHAGLGFMPKNLKLIASKEMIRGGKYEENVDAWFEKNNTDKHLYQIHGHRNLYNVQVNEFPHSFNLNEAVEFGENLRIIEISK